MEIVLIEVTWYLFCSLSTTSDNSWRREGFPSQYRRCGGSRKKRQLCRDWPLGILLQYCFHFSQIPKASASLICGGSSRREPSIVRNLRARQWTPAEQYVMSRLAEGGGGGRGEIRRSISRDPRPINHTLRQLKASERRGCDLDLDLGVGRGGPGRCPLITRATRDNRKQQQGRRIVHKTECGSTALVGPLGPRSYNVL